MLDASGPKKAINYAEPVYDDTDLSSFDLDQGVTQKAVDGQYRMKHTNEKFSIGGSLPKGKAEESIQEDIPVALTEEEELQRALAQIRAMEDQELLARQNSVQENKV